MKSARCWAMKSPIVHERRFRAKGQFAETANVRGTFARKPPERSEGAETANVRGTFAHKPPKRSEGGGAA